MINNKHIKEANLNDIDSLSKLSNSLLPFLFKKELPQWFINDISAESFKERLLSKEYRFFKYIIDDKIVGFISIKDNNQIFHLFVDCLYHKKGIAKKLWEYVKTLPEIKIVKVNSSLYAIDVYSSFGFIKDGEQKFYLGLKYQPMIIDK